jgi:ATP-dependent DNA helicase DinG
MNLEKYFTEFTETFMPKGFIWRKGQKEAIEKIIEGYYDKACNTVILDAPVGSGKSIIAMCASWILNQEGKKGYILSSEISLQDQYETDIGRFNMAWGSVKGLDNYECTDNMERVSLGTCKIQGKEARTMYCYDECPYYSARRKAAFSPTSMLNYAYWLVMMNEVNPRLEEETQLFPKRDFLVCDEAHKLMDIIQNTYSPRFSEKHTERLTKLVKFFDVHKIGELDSVLYAIGRAIKDMKEEEDPEELLGLISLVAISLDKLSPAIKMLKVRVKTEYAKQPPKEWRSALRSADWAMAFRESLLEYINIIEKTSTRNLIKNPNIDEIVFNCLEENYLMHRYFHQHTGFLVLMSATFSDPTNYLKGVALKGAKYIKLESQFDFTRSPIYFYNRRKMSYNQIESNLPWLINQVNSIIRNHPGESGLIHSASYKLALDIFNGLTHENRNRVFIYNGTEEKRNSLDAMKSSRDKILLGPSLLEGLDLKDDFGRFQIFAKVPYLSLADRFVKTKMKINPEWYRQKAATSILQGIGRIVRSETDWGVTYFLDGSLGDLIHGNRRMFPPEFYKRLRIKSE